MKTYIALFRGINIGGKHILPMKELAVLLEKLGLVNVKTYIQSGNVVFQSKTLNTSTLADKISAVINKKYGFAPHVFVLQLRDIKRAVVSNPFPEAESAPKSLHVYFLAATPKKGVLEDLESIKRDSESICLKGKNLYLHAPEGVGKSKLAMSAEKKLGVPVTARNWRTVCKLLEMAEQLVV